MNHFPILFHLNKFIILTTFSSCSIVRLPLNMHWLIKNQVLASRKNMISNAISTLLTYMEIFRLNGHNFVCFIFCCVFFFSFIYFMKKCNNCSSVDLILYTFQIIIIWVSSTGSQCFFRVVNHMAILAEPLLSSHLS